MITRMSILIIKLSLFCSFSSDEIQKAHLSLKAYATIIHTIHIHYTEKWDAASIEHPLVRKVREAELQDLHDKLTKTYGTGGTQLGDRMKEQLKFTKTTVYDLLEKYPLCRLEHRVSQESANGIVETEHVIRYVKSNKLSAVDIINNRVALEQNPDVVYALNTPICAIGLRLPGTLNKKLYELLDDGGHDIKIEGHKNIKGVDTLIIGAILGKSEKLRLYLAPAHSYLPVRSVLSTEFSDVLFERVYEISEFEDVIDQDRKRVIPFPRLITFTDPAGTWTWKINEIDINKSTNANEFDVIIPKSALVYKGKEAPTITLSGGRVAHTEAVKKTIDEANAIIANPPPPAAKAIDYTAWFVGAVIALLTALGVLMTARIFRHRRSANDAT